jgi:hypothetical protein
MQFMRFLHQRQPCCRQPIRRGGGAQKLWGPQGRLLFKQIVRTRERAPASIRDKIAQTGKPWGLN